MKRNLSILMATCMTAALLPANVRAAENFTVTPTDIIADSVSNSEGFGSTTINETGIDPATQEIIDVAEYHGLINREDTVFPYTRGNFAYYVNGDVISYVGGDERFTDYSDLGKINNENSNFKEWNAQDAIVHQPRYYDLNGNRLFEHFTLPDILPEWLDLSEIEARGYTLSDWNSTTMKNGYAKVFLNYYPDMAGGNLIAFIDKTGKVTCIADAIDASFNTPNSGECKGLGAFGDNGWIVYTEPYYGDDAENLDPAAAGGHTIDFNASDTWEQPYLVVGYLDPYGQKVLDVSHMNLADAWPFEEGLSVVKGRNGLKGAIDTNGSLVIPCMYQELTGISDGIFCAQSVEGKWGYIDKAGQIVIPMMYDHAYGWADGLGAVALNGKCGLVDAANNIVLPLEYDDISSFENGVCYGIKERELYIITR